MSIPSEKLEKDKNSKLEQDSTSKKAAISSIFEAIENEDTPRTLELIKDTELDLNTRNNEGDTLLIKATKKANTEVMSVLISKGVEVNLQNSSKKTALDLAVQFYHNPNLFLEYNPEIYEICNDDVLWQPLLKMLFILLGTKTISESIKMLEKNEIVEETLKDICSRVQLYAEIEKFKEKTNDVPKTALMKTDLFALAIIRNDFVIFKIFIDHQDFFEKYCGFEIDRSVSIREEVNIFAFYIPTHLKMQHALGGLMGKEAVKAFETNNFLLSYPEMMASLNRVEMLTYFLLNKSSETRLYSRDWAQRNLMGCIVIATRKKNQNILNVLRKHTLEPVDRPKQKDISTLYIKLLKELRQEYLIAKKNDKRFLIILGENHKSAFSFYLQNIILDIAKKLGMQKIFVELDDSRIDGFLKSSGPARADSNFAFTIFNGLSKGMDVVPIDWVPVCRENLLFFSLGGSKELLRTRKRDENMSKLLSQMNESGLLIVGAAHLEGVMRHLQKTDLFHIASFDISLKNERDSQFLGSPSSNIIPSSCLKGNFFAFDSLDFAQALASIAKASTRWNLNLARPNPNTNASGQIRLPCVNPYRNWVNTNTDNNINHMLTLFDIRREYYFKQKAEVFIETSKKENNEIDALALDVLDSQTVLIPKSLNPRYFVELYHKNYGS